MNQKNLIEKEINLNLTLREADRISSMLSWVKIACKMSKDEQMIIDSFLYKVRSEKKSNNF